MPKLTKEQILSIGPALKEVDVPEWGGSVFIRPITLGEQARLADLGIKHEKGSVMARLRNCTLQLIQWVVCDERGQRLFEPGDLDALLDKGASAFLRLQEEILTTSGLTRESREELEKNLPKAQTARPDSP